MTARIHIHPRARQITPRERANLLLLIAADAAAQAAQSEQRADVLRAELLAAIAADDFGRAFAVLAGLSQHMNARSA
jgi:hypothetical protein